MSASRRVGIEFENDVTADFVRDAKQPDASMLFFSLTILSRTENPSLHLTVVSKAVLSICLTFEE